MKRIAAMVLFFGFAVSNSFADDFAMPSTAGPAKVRPYKFSLGLDMAAAPFSPQGSVSLLYNPNKSIGSAGLLVSRYKSAVLDGYDAEAVIGYWSNDNKEKVLGWHVFFGIGMSSAENRNSVWKVESSPVSSKTLGLGADYFFRLGNAYELVDGHSQPAKRNFAFSLEGVVVQRNVVLVSGGASKVLDKDLFHLDLASDSRLQFGLRTWF